MPMESKGLTKLMEECAEVIQVCAKKLAYMDSDVHPDGKGSLKERMEDELGDMWAAAQFVIDKLGLNGARMESRGDYKLELYKSWDAQTEDTQKPGPAEVQHHRV